MIVLVVVLLAAGLFFLTVSSVGLLRLPDFYSRTHAAGKSETLGAILILLGLVIHEGWALTSLKLLLIVFLVAITNPTGIHAVSRAAIRAGLELWVRPDRAEAGAQGRGSGEANAGGTALGPGHPEGGP